MIWKIWLTGLCIASIIGWIGRGEETQPMIVEEVVNNDFPITARQYESFKFVLPPLQEERLEGNFVATGSDNFVRAIIFDEPNFRLWDMGEIANMRHYTERGAAGTVVEMEFDLSESGAYYLVFSNVSSDLSRTVTADVSFAYLPQTEIPLQQDWADQPAQSLLVFFPEFFPDGVKHSLPLNEILPGDPLKDGIPALTNPTTVPANAADYLNDTDLVLGITINGESRAYPLRILNWHEIANDMLGGKPLAVTFCPLCGTGIALDPVVDGEAIEFGVSGLLHNSDLLMYDRGTDTPSLWAQAPGKAVVGPRTGTLLDLLPITQAQ